MFNDGKVAEAQQEVRELRQRVSLAESVPQARATTASGPARAVAASTTQSGSPVVGFDTGGMPVAGGVAEPSRSGRSTFAPEGNDEERRAAQRKREREWREAAAQTVRSVATTRVESLRLALNLRPDQLARLNAVMESIASSGENFSWRDIRDLNQRLERALDGTLSPDQIAAMNTFKEKETRARTEARTNFEFSMVDVALSLHPSQSDAVFQALARVNSLENDPAFLARVGSEDRDAIRAALAQEKRAALSGLLTPDQMRVYNQFLETQQTMGRRFGR